MTTPLLTAHLAHDTDLLALRRAGREIGRALGHEARGQVRLATALSEVGRAALALGPADVTIRLAHDVDRGRIEAEVVAAGPLAASGSTADGGVPAARRLVDELVLSPDGRSAVLVVALPASARTDAAALTALRRSVRQAHAADALDELRVQNAELLRTHDELLAQQEELRRLNAELEETNRGVVAMFHELSAELEETNSGVVALYAELDERGSQLSAANEAKSRFLRNVSHELRSPVNSIIGLGSLLQESALDGDQRQQVSFVRESAATLLTLVDELLELARAEAGHQDVVPAPIDLAELLAELRGTIQPLVRPGVDLAVGEPPTATLVSDRRLVARVLRNLLSNAAKFTETGSVRLTVRAGDDGTTVFTVTDTGLGVPTDQIDAIFEEFVQVPNHLQPSARGTGLGLPYSRRTAEALGGGLTARSTHGEGSEFTLVLPTLPAHEEPSSVAAPESPPARLGHVLVVDDDRAYGALVAGLLRDEAERVSVAHDARHAHALLNDSPADAVVLDVRMPGTDGVELLARLRDELGDLPAVLMSSGDQPADLHGATFVPKSTLDRATLRAALGRAGGPR
ncbi:signal transduction histidine kinase [Sediminihabitans luteus]|uniref:histidine kinase n=1 Tax=Sediminihabitans luteus TaxID=1138585 RepID=A0A2M9CF20_9CELL|nr:ATP-binding protein [Sediminihabitans luteus]PJJ70452.1 signal transduction histidine kinase [Sediminihabitans luteus]GII97925.1 sensor histidine kinase [Sediminihabitans luteus]